MMIPLLFILNKMRSAHATLPVHHGQWALYTYELRTLTFSTLITKFSQSKLCNALNVPFSISQSGKITDLITDIISFIGLVSKQKS